MASVFPIVGVDALALPEGEIALSKAAVRLLSSADLRREMGSASRRLALEHSLPITAQA